MNLPITELPDIELTSETNTANYEELVRRLRSVHDRTPTTSVEAEYDDSKAVASVRVTLFGRPKDVLAYIIAKYRKGDPRLDAVDNGERERGASE